MKKLTFASALLGLGLSLLSIPLATAAPTGDVEPNDNLKQVTSNINTEGVIGSFGTDDDVDRYYVRFRPQRQIKIAFELIGSTCTQFSSAYPRYSLESLAGSSLASGALYSSNVSDEYSITTPGLTGSPSQTMMLTWDARGYSAGCQYKFTVTSANGGPTDAVDPTPLPQYSIVAVAEPNDVPTQAFGPLSADVNYDGKLETSNDVDYLTVPVVKGKQITVDFTSFAGNPYLAIEDSFGNSIDSLRYVYSQTMETATFTTTTTSLRLIVSGDLNDEYRIRLSPADAIGAPPAPTVPPAPVPTIPPGPSPTTTPISVSLKTTTPVLRKGQWAKLEGRVSGYRGGTMVIWQKMARPGSGWFVEARKRLRADGRFTHFDSITSISRSYKACYNGRCSRTVFVRVR